MTKEESAAIEALAKEFHDFIATYEKDMRGDNDPNSENVGLVNIIRELKKYPSTAYRLAKNPIATTAALLGLFLFLDTLSTFGVLRWIAAWLGFKVP